MERSSIPGSLRRKEGSFPDPGRRNKCEKKKGRFIPGSLRRKEGSVPDLGKGNISGKKEGGPSLVL
jgi:hypothetical protein